MISKLKLDEIFNKENILNIINLGIETEDIEFIENININNKSNLLNIVKIMIGFLNTRTGYIVIGVSDKSFKPIGMSKESYINIIELKERVAEYIHPIPEIFYKDLIFKINNRKLKFGVIYLEPSRDIFAALRDGTFKNNRGRIETIFRSGDVYIRKNEKTIKPDVYALNLLLEKRIKSDYTYKDVSKDLDIHFEDIDITTLKRDNIIKPDYSKFIGRDKYIEESIASLIKRHFVISLIGIGGVGKTALAREVAETLLKQGIFDAVIWVSAKLEELTPLSIEDIVPTMTNYESLLDTILTTLQFDVDSDIMSKHKIVNNILNKIKCLIVIDNLETIDDPRILDFISEIPPPSKVLITSRERKSLSTKTIHLDTMNYDETKQLILMDARDKSIPRLMNAPEEVYKNIFDKSGGIPLAIRWISGVIGKGFGIRHTTKSATKRGSLVLDFCFKEIYTNVLTPDAKLILNSMPIYDDPPDKETIQFITQLKKDNLEAAISELVSFSIIYETRDKENSNILKYDLLPLTKAYAYIQLTEKYGLELRFKKLYTEYLQTIFTRKEVIKQIGHRLEDLGAKTDESKLAVLHAQTAMATYQYGDYERAVQQFEEAIESDPNIPYIYRLWGTVEKQERNISSSKELFTKAHNLDPENSYYIYQLGILEEMTGNYAKAKDIYEKGIELASDTYRLEYKLADTYSREKNYEIANKIFTKIYIERKRVNDTKSLLYISGGYTEHLRNWGIYYSQTGQNKKAEETYFKSLEISEENLAKDPNNSFLLRSKKLCLKNLGRLYLNINKYKEADKFFKLSLNISDFSDFYKDHNSKVYFHLAELKRKQNLPEEAIEFCRSSIQIDNNPYSKRLLKQIQGTQVKWDEPN